MKARRDLPPPPSSGQHPPHLMNRPLPPMPARGNNDDGPPPPPPPRTVRPLPPEPMKISDPPEELYDEFEPSEYAQEEYDDFQNPNLTNSSKDPVLQELHEDDENPYELDNVDNTVPANNVTPISMRPPVARPRAPHIEEIYAETEDTPEQPITPISPPVSSHFPPPLPPGRRPAPASPVEQDTYEDFDELHQNKGPGHSIQVDDEIYADPLEEYEDFEELRNAGGGGVKEEEITYNEEEDVVPPPPPPAREKRLPPMPQPASFNGPDGSVGLPPKPVGKKTQVVAPQPSTVDLAQILNVKLRPTNQITREKEKETDPYNHMENFGVQLKANKLKPVVPLTPTTQKPAVTPIVSLKPVGIKTPDNGTHPKDDTPQPKVLISPPPVIPKPTKKTAIIKPVSPESNNNNNNADDQDMMVYSWYHGNISRAETEKRLSSVQGDGAFLVRKSKKGGEEQPYTLTIFYQDNFFTLKVRCRPKDKQIALGEEKTGEMGFSSVPSLIAYHKEHNVILIGNPGGKTKLLAHPERVD